MADDIDQKGPAQLVADSVLGQEIAHIEEVARVLAIKRCDDLAGIEIR